MDKIPLFKTSVGRFARALEFIIAVAIALGVVLGFFDLVKYYSLILKADVLGTYDVFQGFLGFALLLIVGIEMIFMLLYHSTKAILELILFVIARKLLIYANTMTDIVLGAVAILIIFMTLHFFVKDREKRVLQRKA
ncbi:hypothetical protein ACWODI_01155 [Facklamia languida]|uniref:Protein PsiE n=1 Tax=Facklamia languida CCUG 37842 TaxID=883113 RepID=H3NHG0_9LACT|nr:hypothetical protein [Facklamia languida]EHR38215.1 hypothetical protein HMPREF9708_00299 [Facklamia languida CCUG 37842]